MRTDWRLIGLLFLAGLLAAAQFAKIALNLEALSVAYPGMPLPYAVSVQAVVGLVFGATAGVVVAGIGVRRVLLWGLLASAVVSGLQALLPTFPVFMALRLLEGFAHLAIVIACPTLIAAVATPRDMPVAMGIWGTFFGVGFAGSAAAIPFLGGPGGVLLAHGLAMLAVAGVLWPVLPRGVARRTPGGAEPEGFVARHVAIYRTPRIFAAGAGFLWHSLAFMGLLTFMPGFLGAWTGPVLPIAALVGTFAAGVLARRYPATLIAMAGFAASSAAMVILPTIPAAAQPILALPLFFLMGIVPGACFAMIPALNPAAADQARANGSLAQFGNLGTFFSVPIFASVVGGGVGGTMALAIALSACGLGVLWLIHRQIVRTG